MRISKAQISKARANLEAAPAKEAAESVRAAILQMRPELMAALIEKNWSFAELRDWLAAQGIEVSLVALQRYLVGVRAAKKAAAGQDARAAPAKKAASAPTPPALPTLMSGQGEHAGHFGPAYPAAAETCPTHAQTASVGTAGDEGSGSFRPPRLVLSRAAGSRKHLGERLMTKPIYIVGGSKGGVGKSLVSMALVNHLSQAGEEVFLIDADTSNPDVWKCYEGEIASELVNLDEADGWIRFVNICDENKGSAVVVNTAARNNSGVASYGKTLSQSLEELERQLVTLWVINRQRDSLELLQDYIDAIPNSTVHVFKNGYFGADAKFELYNGSKVKKSVEAKGGSSLLFPDMADRVSDDIYSNRLSIAKAWQTMPIGNRAELRRWLEEVDKVFGPVAVNG